MSETSKKRSSAKGKGSIVLEILAVLLAVALIFSITYPSKLWKQEDKNEAQCRENLWHIYFAELTYMETNLAYNDTLSKVVDFIFSDTSGKKLRRFTGLDSILGGKIIKEFRQVADVVTITMDSVFGQGPDSMITKNVDITIPALLDSMTSFTQAVDLDTAEAFILDSLRTWPKYAARIDSIATIALNNLYLCPTVGREYLVVANNDTTPKLVSIFCPLDSTDQAKLKANFSQSFLGGLRIENHGKIENGAKSW